MPKEPAPCSAGSPSVQSSELMPGWFLLQICGIHAQRFLSLADFHWGDLDPGLNVLVGPNGSGKTNILRVVGTVIEALAWTKRTSVVAEPFTPGDYLALGTQEGRYDLGVDVMFNTQAERDLLTTYFQAAMLDMHSIQRMALPLSGGPQPQISPARLHMFAERVSQAVAPNHLQPLFRGRIGLRCWARADREYLTYFAFGDKGAERYILLGPNPTDLFVTSVPFRPLGSYASNSLLWLYWSTLNQDQQGAIRGFLLGESADVALPPFDLDALWSSVTPEVMGNVQLNTQAPDGSYSEPYYLLLKRLGLSLVGGIQPTLAAVVGRMLEAAVFRTDNLRIRPKRTYSTGDFLTRPAELSSGEDLALHLFRLKNGTADQRLSFRSIQHSFRRLMPGARFDVRAVDLPPPDGPHNWQSTDRADLSLQIVISHRAGDVPLEASGAGMVEAVYLATALDFAQDHVLMLDEPALNLHPAIQRRLLRSIVARTEQTIVVTHSPYLVPTNRLQHVRRVAIRDHATVLSQRFTGLTRSQQDIQLPRILERSRDAVAALFATCMLLVDGPAELSALPGWFERHTGGKLVQDYGAEICPIHGKTSLGLYLAYLTAFGVPQVVMVDGDALGPGPGNVWRQFGYAGVQLPQATDFDAQKSELRKHNVFVMGSATDQSFDSKFINIHAAAAPSEVPNKGPALAFWVAENRPCPPEISEVFAALTGLARRHQR